MLVSLGADMGRELLCKARSGDKTASGNALLETSEIIFRGDFRLKIAFASLKSVIVRDGELHLKWPEGSAVLELGEQAEKWAHKILHPKSTAEKLGIKPGLAISAVAMADGNFVKELRRRAVDCLSKRQTGDHRATGARRRQSRGTGGCESRQLLRDAHSFEVRT